MIKIQEIGLFYYEILQENHCHIDFCVSFPTTETIDYLMGLGVVFIFTRSFFLSVYVNSIVYTILYIYNTHYIYNHILYYSIYMLYIYYI